MVETLTQPIFENTVRDPETGHTPDSFRFYPNGVDLKIQTESPYFKYETQCFEALINKYPELYGIGPHMIDRIFGRTPGFKTTIRPDAILITPGENPVLKGLSEFKYSRANGLHRKVNGFSVLLDQLRTGHSSLSDVLNSIGTDFQFPQIEIPPDDEIFVRFISQKERREGEEDEIVTDGTSPFPVRHTRVIAAE